MEDVLLFQVFQNLQVASSVQLRRARHIGLRMSGAPALYRMHLLRRCTTANLQALWIRCLRQTGGQWEENYRIRGKQWECTTHMCCLNLNLSLVTRDRALYLL